MLRRSSDSNGEMSESVIRTERFWILSLAKRGCFGHNSNLAVQRLSAVRLLHMSFILEYLWNLESGFKNAQA